MMTLHRCSVAFWALCVIGVCILVVYVAFGRDEDQSDVVANQSSPVIMSGGKPLWGQGLLRGSRPRKTNVVTGDLVIPLMRASTNTGTLSNTLHSALSRWDHLDAKQKKGTVVQVRQHLIDLVGQSVLCIDENYVDENKGALLAAFVILENLSKNPNAEDAVSHSDQQPEEKE